MLRKLGMLTLLFMVLLGATASRADELASEGPVVRLVPSEFRINPGERKRIYVQVDGIPEGGLAAFQFDLNYDPRVVELVDPNLGHSLPQFSPLGGSPLCAAVRRQIDCPDPVWMLTAEGRQAIGTVAADDVAGRLTIAYGTIAAPSSPPPVIGEGTLAVIEVVGRASTKTRLTFGDLILADGGDPPRRYDVRVEATGRGERRRKRDR